MKIHLDTDIGGDIDDLCALAMILRWPGIELTGITTTSEENGKRAGYARYVLAIEGKQQIPVAAGADVAQNYYRLTPGYPPEEVYWPQPVSPSPNPVEDALLLLKQSIEQGAVVAAIGPYTNLFLLEQRYPGILNQAQIFLMGGYIFPCRPGYPQMTAEDDWNVQLDPQSAQLVVKQCRPTLVPLSVTLETSLRRAYLEPLRQAGALGRLIARQTEAWAGWGHEKTYGETCANLPNDIVNFQHDPLTCAIALGWREGVRIEEVPLRTVMKDRLLFSVHKQGKPTKVVTQVDGNRFNEFWLDTITTRG